MKKQLKNTAGYSILELLFVITIIICLLTLIITSFSFTESNKLSTDGNRFVETLQYARRYALNRHCFVAVGITSNNKYSLFYFFYKEKEDDIEEWVQFTKWQTLDPKNKFIFDKINLKLPKDLPEDFADYVVFLPDGGIAGITTKKIVLSSKNNEKNLYNIYILLYTGIIKIDRI